MGKKKKPVDMSSIEGLGRGRESGLGFSNAVENCLESRRGGK